MSGGPGSARPTGTENKRSTDSMIAVAAGYLTLIKTPPVRMMGFLVIGGLDLDEFA
ncbi:hypothetical protein SDC9_138998 [bioreactor metagenome]|uniref:Uncharacterized protein n=1 Tax=bioreactor metagenome TaxID=1076179 RepID=A0A645DQX5_9ZZZZ